MNFPSKLVYKGRTYFPKENDVVPFRFVVPDSGTFWRVGHDWESDYWNRQPRQIELRFKKADSAPTYALPETAKAKIDNFNELSEAWQWFWWDLMKRFATDMDDESFLAAWISATQESRAMTDNHAAENGYQNFPSEAHGYRAAPLNGKGGIQIKELSMGGNILKQIGTTDKNEPIMEAFDPSVPPPSVDDAIRLYPHKIMWATEVACPSANTGKWDGYAYSKPFPQIRDKDNIRTGVPYPLVGKGGQIVFRLSSKTDKCLNLYRINNGVSYSPYVKVGV